MKLIDSIHALKLIPQRIKHLRYAKEQLKNINFQEILDKTYVANISNTVSIKAVVKSYFWGCRLIKDCDCLPRSIALYQCLKSLGYEVEHKFGVNKKDKTLAAHAWIEYQGKPLNEPVDLKNRFSVLEKFI